MKVTKRMHKDFNPEVASRVPDQNLEDPELPGKTPDAAGNEPPPDEPIRCASPPCSMPEIED